MEIRDSIFISYSHEDQPWREKFEEMLAGQKMLRAWSDQEIDEGEDWDERIQSEIARTRIALLLVSPTFVNSDYITNVELPLILQAREAGLVVKWVMLSPAIVPDDLAKLQVFKVQGSAEMALSQLADGDAQAEIKSICERIIEEIERYPKVHRGAFLESVQHSVRGFGYNVREEIATGDYSVVYRAEEPGGYVAIKALVMTQLEDFGEESTADLERCAKLKNPAFIALRRYVLESDHWLLVTDFVDARRLSRFRHLPVDQVRFVLQQLAAALAECHRNKIVYGNLKPSDVLLKRRRGDLRAHIAACRFSQLVHRWESRSGGFLVNPERLTYLAPEQYARGDMSEKTDQYSLGLLAIEMLQGKPPVWVEHLRDLEEKKRFFEDPAGFGGEWLDRSPSLTRVILRMLEEDPKKRWRNLGEALSELGGGRRVADNNRWLAKGSYQRLAPRRDEFYRAFYQRLFRKRRSLKAKFPDRHDWDRQYRLLDAAVCGLLNFSHDLAAVEPTTLTGTASNHLALNLAAKDFDAFEEAFLSTLARFDEADEETQGAWRATFEPGIRYMKEHGTRKTAKRRKGTIRN